MTCFSLEGTEDTLERYTLSTDLTNNCDQTFTQFLL